MESKALKLLKTAVKLEPEGNQVKIDWEETTKMGFGSIEIKNISSGLYLSYAR
jgi:hypothetical protein